MQQPAFLPHVLTQHAQRVPDRSALRFLPDGEREADRLTYAALDARVHALAARLRDEGMAGERVLILLPSCVDYLVALLGCLAAKAIAVPVFPPARGRHADRIRTVADDCRPRLAITDGDSLAEVRTMLPGTAVWTGADLPRGGGEGQDGPSLDLDGAAYLQYTSGSTSSPRGVVVTHRSLLHQFRLLALGMQITQSDVNVTWLPLFHDLGLILGAVAPLWLGAEVVLMPPAAFVQRPLRWLAAITRYRGTVSHGPTFAFDLCVRRIREEDRHGLDLASWRVAGVGAEPVRADTLERFARTFAGSGFHFDAFTPGLGMAEATLVVANRDRSGPVRMPDFDAAALTEHRLVPASPGRTSRRLVSNGHPWLDTELLIVDPDTRRPCPSGAVGEIWIRGRTVAAGYWGQPEATARVFGGQLENGAGPYFRTGDMAAVLDGELYITGRLGDRIVVRGRNHYPNDLELTVADAHPALGARGAAFAVEAGDEELVVAAHEVAHPVAPAELPALAQAVRRAVAEVHELALDAVVLLKPGGVPTTSSGKIRRNACRDRYLRGELDPLHVWRADEAVPAAAPVRDAADVAGWLRARIAEVARLPVSAVGADQPFSAFGLDSADTVELTGRLEEWLGRPVDPTLVYLHPTVERLAAELGAGATATAPGPAPRPAAVAWQPIAVVGMACRFPGAGSAAEFWSLLSRGADAIREVPESRWRPDGTPGLARGGFVDGVDELDAAFFGISRPEADRMDPQQRLLLTETWRALEAAGIPPGRLAGSATGVFVGISTSDYHGLQVRDAAPPGPHAGTGMAFSVAANRISYLLDLHGPSVAIDTACSSSLVALHQACLSLLLGECDLAIVGAVNLLLEPDLSRTFAAAGMLAADGRCKAFDADADGYVRSEGVGVVVLERHADAVRHGDRVRGLVRGSAVNQDGRSNGLTAPNGLAQRAVIRQALAAAGLTPGQVSYVEAHGTGTSLGDPIEMGALLDVYGRADGPEGRLWVGSAKTNVGHLEAAAGMAGLIKALLALEHETIPAHLHLRALNPRISLDGTRCAIPVEPLPWPRNGRPRAAGVSSFGFGGTNAHVIVEEAPPVAVPAAPAPDGGAWHLLPVSARTAPALAASVEEHARFLAGRDDLAAVCHTAGARREHHPQRVAVLARSAAEATDLLDRHSRDERPAGVWSAVAEPGGLGRIAFLFTGQGAAYPGMARALHGRSAAFARTLERCDERARATLGASLLPTLCEARSGAEGERVDLDEPRYGQPALFAFEYALAETWRSCGIRPDLVLGHSLGEYVAACVAGVLDVEDALDLVLARAALTEERTRDGAMLAVRGPAPELERLRAEVAMRGDELGVAALNGPEDLVLAGDRTALDEVAARWRGRVHTVRLANRRAYHSPLMRPMAAEFRERAGRVAYRPPRIPLVSNLTGAVAGDEIATADYWVRHLLEPVRFGDGLLTLLQRGCRTFVEVGPQPVLVALGRQLSDQALWLPSQRQGDDAEFLRAAGRLYVAGAALDWDGLETAPPAPVDLPGHPLRPRRYWYQAGARPPAPAAPAGHPLLGTRLDLAGAAAHFAGELATDRPAFVAQHRLFGVPTLPASALLEWALAAADGAGTLERVVLPLALAIPEDRPVPVQATAEPEGDAVRVRCYARTGAEWSLHLDAVARRAAPPARTLPLDELRARLPEQPVEDGSTGRGSAGLEHGPAFRGLRRVWRSGAEALGRVEVAGTDEDGYGLHPAVLDACFHVAAAAAGRDVAAAVPVAVDAVEVRASLPGRVWCHAIWRPADEAADLLVADEAGDVLVALRGLRVRALAEGGERGPERYEVRWVPLAPAPPLPRRAASAWLVLGHDAALSGAWRQELDREGHAAVAVGPDEGCERALEELRERGLGVAGLLLRCDGPATFEDAGDAAVELTRGVLPPLQRFLRSCLADRPEVVLCSRGPVARSVLAGLTPAVAAEFPSLRCVHVDVEGGDPGALAVLGAAAALDASGQVAWREGRWHAARLARLPRGDRRSVEVRPDATYLVTGGWGGIGLAVAGWLAGRGARHLALVGRTRPALEPEAIGRLRAAGVEVAMLEAQVGDARALERALAELRRRMPPLRGVVHAAGVTADAPFEELDWPRIEAVLEPKVRGAWHLHRLTVHDELDWFVACPSLVALLGSGGQAAYAVANAFLDELARSRREGGRPALSVAWGPWSETGMAVRQASLERFARLGVRGLPTRDALDALDELLADAPPHVAVADVDWTRYVEAMASAVPPALLAEVASTAGGAPAWRRDELERLAVQAPDAARSAVLDDLLDRVTTALGLEPAVRDELRPTFAATRLNQLGLDSLMAVRLRGRLLVELGADVPPQTLIGGGTVADVAELVVEQLALGQIVAADDEPAAEDTELVTL